MDKSLSKQLVRELLLPLAVVSGLSAIAAFWPVELDASRATSKSATLPVTAAPGPETAMRNGATLQQTPLSGPTTRASANGNI